MFLPASDEIFLKNFQECRVQVFKDFRDYQIQIIRVLNSKDGKMKLYEALKCVMKNCSLIKVFNTVVFSAIL